MGELAVEGEGDLKAAYASFVIDGVVKNSIFDLKNPGNRDDCYYPYWLLREKLKEQGVELNTADVNTSKSILFELHLDVKQKKSEVPCYVLLWETSQIFPNNRSPRNLGEYRRIFSWDDGLVDGERFIKLNIPNRPMTFPLLGFQGREKLCCLIAGNKSVRRKDVRELYTKRVETIRWFEIHAKQDFDLYGIGWQYPPARAGYLGRLLFKVTKPLFDRLNNTPFPSYRGLVERKNETLSRYKFTICYENVSGLRGYITEKIFDCFFAGCVPVYWGADNIEDYVPAECFIDRRKFADHESLHQYLSGMAEARYVAYQQAIQVFLASEAAQLFYAEHFVTTIVHTILADLERLT